MVKSFELSIAVATLASITATSAFGDAAPPQGHAGECFERVIQKPLYRTVTERIQGSPVVSYRDTPAVVGHRLKSVLASPARVEHETIPAVYRTVQRWSDAPGPSILVRSPPVYRTVTERRLIEEAHLEWRTTYNGVVSVQPGYGPGYSAARPTGEVVCRVLTPARYAIVTRRVLVSPGGLRTEPGRRRKVVCYERVLVSPARVVDHAIPARYRTVSETFIVHPATHTRIVTPGGVRVVSRQVLAAPARVAWIRLPCRAAHDDAAAHAAPSPQRDRPAGGLMQPAAPSGRLPSQERPRAASPSYPDTYARPLTPAPYDVGHPAN